MASILRANLQPATPRTPTLPPIRYAAAAAAAVGPQSTQQNGTMPLTPSISQPLPPTVPTSPHEATLSITPSASQGVLQESQLMSSPSLTHPSVTSPMLSSAASHQQDGSFYSGQDSPAISDAVPSSISGPAATSSPQRQQKGTLSIPSMRMYVIFIQNLCHRHSLQGQLHLLHQYVFTLLLPPRGSLIHRKIATSAIRRATTPSGHQRDISNHPTAYTSTSVRIITTPSTDTTGRHHSFSTSYCICKLDVCGATGAAISSWFEGSTERRAATDPITNCPAAHRCIAKASFNNANAAATASSFPSNNVRCLPRLSIGSRGIV